MRECRLRGKLAETTTERAKRANLLILMSGVAATGTGRRIGTGSPRGIGRRIAGRRTGIVRGIGRRRKGIRNAIGTRRRAGSGRRRRKERGRRRRRRRGKLRRRGTGPGGAGAETRSTGSAAESGSFVIETVILGTGLSATKASFLGGRKLTVGKWAAPTARRSFSVSAAAASERPLWFPGSTPPEWLDGSLPGDFGFDPLGLGSDPESLRWNQQAEIVHCRWAMLGAAGIFIPEFLTKIGVLNTPSWYTAGTLEYFTDTTTLFVIELILIGWAEGRRWADIIKPGCVNTDPIFPNNKLTGTDVGYPGGFWFDPLGWGSGSPEKIKELRTKEIKNGRLAMLAVMGAWFQAIYTGTGPIDNLFAHLADPGHATIFAAFTPK